MADSDRKVSRIGHGVTRQVKDAVGRQLRVAEHSRIQGQTTFDDRLSHRRCDEWLGQTAHPHHHIGHHGCGCLFVHPAKAAVVNHFAISADSQGAGANGVVRHELGHQIIQHGELGHPCATLRDVLRLERIIRFKVGTHRRSGQAEHETTKRNDFGEVAMCGFHGWGWIEPPCTEGAEASQRSVCRHPSQCTAPP